MNPKKEEILLFTSSQEFEHWLEKNHATASSIWIRMYKKDSGKTSITYDQALDVALCFGWIDGIARRYDEASYMQRFTPRRPKSIWSKRNTEHIERLTKEGKMRPSGILEVEKAKKDGRWEAAYASPATATIPEDFLKELEKNKEAKAFFTTLSKANLYAIAYRLLTAKKPETRERRKQLIIDMLAKKQTFH